jgi:hypothetical protein
MCSVVGEVPDSGKRTDQQLSDKRVSRQLERKKSLLESRLERSRWRDGPPACYCHFNPFAGKRCGERLSDFACT